MKWIHTLLIVAIFLFHYLPVSPIHSSESEAALKCNEIAAPKMKLTKVADGIYVREGVHEIMTKQNLAGIANIGFIMGNKSIAVIDSGGTFCDGLRLKAAIRSLSKLPISHVINTHHHPDHVFGNAVFINEGAIFIAHHKLKPALIKRGPFFLENIKRLIGDKAMSGVKIIPPNEMVKSIKKIDLGHRVITLTAHNTAHTDNDLTVYDENTKTIWTGDLLFETRLPVIDGSILGWLKTIDDLALIEAAHVIPGHGSININWHSALKKQKAYLTKLASDLRKIIAEGGTMLEAQKTAGKSEKHKWKLFDEFNARNASSAFAELEWEE